MTQIATEQQQWEAARASAAAKLQDFDAGLTADERLALVRALQDVEGSADVDGYKDNILNWKPSPLGCLLWQERMRSLVEVLTLGIVSDFTPDCSSMLPPGEPV